MKIRLIQATGTWEACYPQAGTFAGWSQWETINRLQALRYIELGWTFEIV